MSRRKGRILAFQALYSYDVGNIKLEDLLKFEWENNDFSDSSESKNDEAKDLNSDSYTFARLLISGTIENLDKIDEVIKKHLSSKWELERINKVSLAILRISIYSLMFQSDIPQKVVIDEAVAISKEYGEDDSFKFINGVLDNVRKEINS